MSTWSKYRQLEIPNEDYLVEQMNKNNFMILSVVIKRKERSSYGAMACLFTTQRYIDNTLY